MNAKSEHASLPDRVEAAAKARHEAQFPETPWRVMSEPTKSHDRELMKVALAAADACEAERAIDASHLASQREWSLRTFGPGPRTGGVTDHIRKELTEIEQAPNDLSEWVDVIILSFDGAWRTGAEPQSIIDAIKAKQAKNEQREWPDWRSAPTDRAIEHVREAERNPNTTDEYEQVGWYFDDEWTPPRMSRSEWESERLVTSRAIDDEDGLAPPWDERAKPVFVRRPVSSEDVHREGQSDG